MAAKKKTGAFEGDGAERFFSLGNIPKQKLTKKQQKAVAFQSDVRQKKWAFFQYRQNI